MEQNFETLGEMMNIEDSCDKDNPPPQKKKRKWIKMLLVVLFVGAGVFLSNWYIEIDINSLPNEIKTSAEMGIPKSYLRGRWFCKEGMEINTKQEEIHHSSKIGKYANQYSASFIFYFDRVKKEFNVIDDVSPIIELNYLPGYVVKFDEEYVEEGFVAFDEYDGILTKDVKSEIKDGFVIYTVSDSSGNECVAQREIKYADTKPPTIKLNGSNPLTLYVGMDYEELGAIAIDENDGDVSDSILSSNNINTDVIGQYEVQYSAKDMYDNEAIFKRTVNVIAPPREEKVIYLTFDDGPGPYTEELLNILDQYNVKATFFVCNSNKYNHLLKEIVDRGHAIAIHSKTHDYEKIYANKDAFMSDLYSMQDIIETHTGVKTMLMRFPGGGSNLVSQKYCKGIMTELVKMVDEAGFEYFDWNVVSGDAGDTKNKNVVVQNVINGIMAHNQSIVLQHDIKDFSVKAIPEIIQWGIDNGYEFHPLNMYSLNARHEVVN